MHLPLFSYLAVNNDWFIWNNNNNCERQLNSDGIQKTVIENAGQFVTECEILISLDGYNAMFFCESEDTVTYLVVKNGGAWKFDVNKFASVFGTSKSYPRFDKFWSITSILIIKYWLFEYSGCSIVWALINDLLQIWIIVWESHSYPQLHSLMHIFVHMQLKWIYSERGDEWKGHSYPSRTSDGPTSHCSLPWWAGDGINKEGNDGLKCESMTLCLSMSCPQNMHWCILSLSTCALVPGNKSASNLRIIFFGCFVSQL